MCLLYCYLFRHPRSIKPYDKLRRRRITPLTIRGGPEEVEVILFIPLRKIIPVRSPQQLHDVCLPKPFQLISLPAQTLFKRSSISKASIAVILPGRQVDAIQRGQRIATAKHQGKNTKQQASLHRKVISTATEPIAGHSRWRGNEVRREIYSTPLRAMSLP